MSHGQDDDDPQLKSLRAVWLSMPDEDPPERGLDALLAAARVKATELAAPGQDEAPAPSWWQRFVAGLRRPPVLALATVVVLVAGAVVLGNRHGKLDATAPSGGARPSPEDVSTQGHLTEQSHEAPPPPAPAEQPVVPDRKEKETGAGGEVQLAAPRDDEGIVKAAREDETRTIDTPTNEKATTAKHEAHQADAVRPSCSTVRAKLQTLKAAEAQSYRSKVASDPALSKCLEPAAEATTTAAPAP